MLTRRQFLTSAGAAATVAASGGTRALALGGPTGTTLDQTIIKGSALASGTRGSYYRLIAGPGEARIVRDDLGVTRTATPARASLLHFVHLTDIHIIDTQSPARVEWFERYADDNDGCQNIPFQSAHRPQETLTTQTLEAMIRAIRTAAISPVTGAPISFAMVTGDNIDNQQYNETRWFIDLMDGGAVITPDSGALGTYEGVQSSAFLPAEDFWHPDAGPDKYKRYFGFPDYPGLLTDALAPFAATGIGVPWLQVFGNHDGLLQGNAPRNEAFAAAATGRLKVVGPPPGLDPCTRFELFRANPAALLAGPAMVVTPDPARRVVRRREYIAEHFTTSTNAGHGFTAANLASGVAYYADRSHPGFLLIGLDSVNPGGLDAGSIGAAQFAWLEQQLISVSSAYRDVAGSEVANPAADPRRVILFSHHGLRSMENENVGPDPMEPDANDLPRMHAGDVEALLHRFPNVIAWVNGHTHSNTVRANRGASGGFWDIGTAAHIDFNCQSRLVEVVGNGDGTLSIFGTMIDHAGPITPGGSDPVLKLASIQREVAANDPQYGFPSKGPGTPEDRNVELVILDPLPAGALTPMRASALMVPRSAGQLAGVLAASGLAHIIARRMRDA